MAPRAAASPAWLGLFAVATFGGLVLASFASGYHLVGRAAPRSAPVAPAGAVSAPPGASERMLPAAEPSRAEPAPASGAAPAASEVAPAAGGSEPASPEKPSAGRKARGAMAPQSATVRQHLSGARAVVHGKPEGHDRVAVLIGKQQVTVLARQGRWCRIEYRRFGKTITGWTDEANLTFP